MKKLRFMIAGLAMAALALTMVSCEKLEDGTSGGVLSNEEVIQGLKEALNVGTDTSVSILNKLNGYYGDEAVKILLPPEAVVIYDNLSKVPGGSALLEKTIVAMNRAAEDAATEAKP